MSQPPESDLPAYGTPVPPPPPGWAPPQHPHPQAPSPQKPSTGSRTADQVVSWILWVLHVLGAVGFAVVSLFTIFLTDSCGTGGLNDTAAVCDSDYFGSVLIGYWIALVVIPILTLIAIIVATARSRMAWPWSVGGAVATTIATVLFFALVSR